MKISASARMVVLLAALAAAAVCTAPSFAQRFDFDPGEFRFEGGDARGNEGKRAACEVYAQIAVVQALANRRYNCGLSGIRWDASPRAHFRWCRFVSRERKVREQIERARDLQACYDRLGDFDEEREDRREDRREERREDRR